jgi:SAM-dependent methyltransferase
MIKEPQVATPTANPSALVMPSAVNDGRHVPTLNGKGWMLTSIIPPVDQFIELASRSQHWSLDIGCAYGTHTLAALKAGARVVANDLDARHLAILRHQVPPELQKNLRTKHGAFQSVTLPVGGFEAILACRVLHFLDGTTLEWAVAKLFDLLVARGKVFVKTNSPYMALSKAFIPEYERRKAAGQRWPGFLVDHSAYVSDPQELAATSGQLHLFEPEVLSRPFAEAGFIIERCEFRSIPLDWVYLDGRESVLLVARKPG